MTDSEEAIELLRQVVQHFGNRCDDLLRCDCSMARSARWLVAQSARVSVSGGEQTNE